MNDIIASGAIHSIKTIFQKKNERNVIIDPFSCLVKLSLLRFLEQGTKISIYQNRIHFNSPSYIQGFIRFMYGDNREHLHNLYLPIQKCVEWFWNDKNIDMTYMFENAVTGLKMLKYAYSEYATIQHTIDYYIIIMMQKNSQLISKLGFISLDNKNISTFTKSNIKIEIEEEPTFIETENNSNCNSISNGNGIDNKNKNNKHNKSKNDKTDKTDIKNNLDVSRDVSVSRDDKNNIDAKDIRDSILLKQLKEQEKTKDIHIKDMHKFLFEIWNLREIDIVINLYREMETKQAGYERDSIYANIMSYCSMKENKLFEYIESNSSIL